jgi:MYXO-CTERM domain-containing protein
LQLAAFLFAVVPVHIVPMGAPPSQPGAPVGEAAATVPSCGGSCNLQYWGGHVISNVKIYAVFWGSGVNATTQSGIGGFFTALTNSPWMDWMTEFRTDITAVGGGSGTGQLVGRGQFAGPPITVSPSSSASCAGRSSTNPLLDSAIQAELVRQIDAGGLPDPDENTLYMIYFPPGCVISDGSSKSCVQFCAYHSTLTRLGRSVFYGVVPDFGTGSGCDIGCGRGTAFQNMCSASSHEVGEAITDAEVGLASTFGPPLGWYDKTSNAENGDTCNQDTATITSIVDGTIYTVQQMYSQVSRLCEDSRTDANDFNVFMNPNTATLPAGGAIAVPINTTRTAGSPPALKLALGPLPAGVTGSFDATSLSAGQTTNLRLSASPSATGALDAVVVVTACAGTGSCPSPGVPLHAASLLLQVTGSGSPANDFSISVAPQGPTGLVAGGSIAYAVSTSLTSGLAESISLQVTGLPPGVSGAFAPTPIIAGDVATLTLSASSGATPGPLTTFTVKGMSASVPAGHAALGQVQVDGPPSVSLSLASSVSGAAPISASGAAGAGSSLTSLAIAIDGHVAVSSPTSPLAMTWDTTKVLNGPHTVVATATDADGGTRSAQASVTVTNDFTLAISPSSTTLTIGRSAATFTLSSSAVGGPEIIQLALTGLPAGILGSLDPPLPAAGTSSLLTLSAPPGATPGRSTFTVHAATVSAPSGHQVSADLLVISAPTASLVAPSSASVSGKVTLTASATADANAGLVRLQVKDGDTVLGTVAGPALSVMWDTTQVPDGSHPLSAVALDGAGNSATSATVTVMVSNSSGGGCSTGGASGAEAFALIALLLATSRRRAPQRA